MIGEKLSAQIRTKFGSRESNRLRRRGWVPAVLYGPEQDEVLLKIESKELRNVMAKAQRGIIELQVSAEDGKLNTYPAMVKEIQRDSLKGDINHLDLYLVSLTRKITTSVPVRLIGTPAGTNEGGILQHQLWEVELECLPTELPSQLEADVSDMNVGDVLTVAEIPVPEGVSLLTPLDSVVASVLAPVEETDEEQEETEVEIGTEPTAVTGDENEE